MLPSAALGPEVDRPEPRYPPGGTQTAAGRSSVSWHSSEVSVLASKSRAAPAVLDLRRAGILLGYPVGDDFLAQMPTKPIE